MHIRPYTLLDREPCLAAFKSNIPLFFAPHELHDYQKWLDEELDQNKTDSTIHQEYFVAEENNNILGCGGYAVEEEKQTATMTWGLVHQSFHKRGIGKTLLQHRIAIIQSTYPTCRIRLDTTQHAFGFFEKLGFVVEKITNNFYAPGLDRYDMELKKESE